MRTDKRAELGFNKIIQEKFEFLVNQFGYAIEHADDYHILYRSKKTYVEIYHDKMSYEIDSVLGTNMMGTTNFRMTILDILKAKNVNITNKLFQASSESSLEIVVEKLANLIKEHAKEFLSGDIVAFKNVQRYIDNSTDKFEKRNKLSIVERRAELAWRNGEYQTLIDLYSDILNDLNEIQKRRLSYAKLQMKHK